MPNVPLAESRNSAPKTQRIEWIDCARFVAIFLVVVDHTYGITYTNALILTGSFLSVSLFVLLAGISAWLSYNPAKQAAGASAIRRVTKLFLQYALATFIIQCVRRHAFDLEIYIDQLLHFDASIVFYFLAFFFQLTLVAPMLVQWCGFCNRQKAAPLWQAVTVACLCVFAWFSYKRTIVFPSLYGSGKYLLGATYVILYYIGILLASRGIFERTTKQKAVILAVSAPVWIAWWLLMGNGILPYGWLCAPFWGDGFNPPGLVLMLFAVITLFLLFSLFSLLSASTHSLPRKLSSFAATAGRYSLFIFLYHSLVKSVLLQYFPVLFENMWLARFFVFIPMIAVPMFAAIAWERVRRKVFVKPTP